MTKALLMIGFAALAAPTRADTPWQHAERQWNAFVRVRQESLSEPRTVARFQHPLLERHFPMCRFYADGVQVYVLTQEGRVYAHAPRNLWTVQPAWCKPPTCEVRDASDILQSAGILVRTATEASDVVRLYHLIISNGHVPGPHEEILGAYRPVAREDGVEHWRVDLVYAGNPSASRFVQPAYVLQTDRKRRLIELRVVRDSTAPGGERQ